MLENQEILYGTESNLEHRGAFDINQVDSIIEKHWDEFKAAIANLP